MRDTIDTTWDELPEVLRQRVRRLGAGARRHHVRGFIVRSKDEHAVLLAELGERPAVSAVQASQWTRRLKVWAESHPRLPHEVDDSRDTIYLEAVRDLSGH
jgi:hypothetical protein